MRLMNEAANRVSGKVVPTRWLWDFGWSGVNLSGVRGRLSGIVLWDWRDFGVLGQHQMTENGLVGESFVSSSCREGILFFSLGGGRHDP